MPKNLRADDEGLNGREDRPSVKLLLGIGAAFLVATAVFAVGAMIALNRQPSIQPSEESLPVAPAPQPPRPQPLAARDVKVGDPGRVGALVITIPEIRSGQFAGQHYLEFTPVNLTMVKLTVQNVSAGKIVDWRGWQGKATVEDEHGNRFPSFNLRGWSALPSNNTLDGGWDGDTGARIHPGRTYVNALYHQYMPRTSKEAVVTVSLEGLRLFFRGPITPHKQ